MRRIGASVYTANVGRSSAVVYSTRATVFGGCVGEHSTHSPAPAAGDGDGNDGGDDGGTSVASPAVALTRYTATADALTGWNLGGIAANSHADAVAFGVGVALASGVSDTCSLQNAVHTVVAVHVVAAVSFVTACRRPESSASTKKPRGPAQLRSGTSES